MKLTTKNLLIVFVVLVAALAITQLTKRSGRSKSLRAELVSIDTAEVSRIEISAGEVAVLLSENEGGWEVALEDGTQKRAKEDAVTSLLSSLSTIKPGRMAAKSADKWKDYQVDSAGTRVKVFEGNEVATDIVIGRFGVEGQQSFYTFVRLFEDNEVYVAPNFMGISIGKDAASYRENTVMRLQKDSLTMITFNYPDSSFQLSKGEQWYMADQLADSASVVSYLNGLSFLNSKEFFDESIPGSPSHSVTFSFSNQQDVILDAYPVAGELVVRSSDNTNESFKDPALIKKAFKGPGAFLPTSE